MRKFLMLAVLLIAGGSADAAETKPPPPIDLNDNYVAQAVVTGKDERNRPLGFKLCFEDVLVRASGDVTILDSKRVPALAARAADFIDSFSYFDRLSGRAIHDEQGTYDRPHFLTCHFNPAKIDNVLASLGRRIWKGKRPTLAMIVTVRGRNRDGVLAKDGEFDPDMRESLGNAVRRYGLNVVLPAAEPLRANGITAQAGPKLVRDKANASAEALAKVAGGDQPLIGDLAWSDKAHGWIATWRISARGRQFVWSASGINYDEAFRVALRGAMRALSGNGAPVSRRTD
ncbi:MAG: DUF2066 domain-containing protein [Pseudolabrys sp.]|nr:DUF2066 domain-containing protein [Pseudolabrys sp.]